MSMCVTGKVADSNSHDPQPPQPQPMTSCQSPVPKSSDFKQNSFQKPRVLYFKPRDAAGFPQEMF